MFIIGVNILLNNNNYLICNNDCSRVIYPVSTEDSNPIRKPSMQNSSTQTDLPEFSYPQTCDICHREYHQKSSYSKHFKNCRKKLSLQISPIQNNRDHSTLANTDIYLVSKENCSKVNYPRTCDVCCRVYENRSSYIGHHECCKKSLSMQNSSQNSIDCSTSESNSNYPVSNGRHKINYPRTCGACHKQYQHKSSYSRHFKHCKKSLPLQSSSTQNGRDHGTFVSTNNYPVSNVESCNVNYLEHHEYCKERVPLPDSSVQNSSYCSKSANNNNQSIFNDDCGRVNFLRTCDVCCREFMSKSSYLMHSKYCKKNLSKNSFIQNSGEENNYPFCIKDCPQINYHRKCNVCHREYKTNGSFNRHQKSCKKHLFKHKSTTFNIFQTMDEFYLWLENMSRRTFSSFTKFSGSKVSEKKSYHYYCCQFYRPRKPAMRITTRRNRKGTLPRDINCPARITVCESPDNISAKYYGVHNHELGLRRYPPVSEKPYECEICQKCFSYKGLLDKHVVFHTKEKLHECEVCHKMFSYKTSLNKHMRTHPGKTYECETCEKFFLRKESLDKHLLAHTVVKPNECETCYKGLKCKNSLCSLVHVDVKEKLFNCEICQETFPEEKDLSKHVVLHEEEAVSLGYVTVTI